MPESDQSPRSERPRSPGAIPDQSTSPRPEHPSDDTDVLGAFPPSSYQRGDSNSRSSTERDAQAEPMALPNLGEKIDEFRLVESIGAGGMGAVFRAVDVGLDRQVALKILPPEQAIDPEVVRRYHQEGRAAARLDHENIARVYTIGDNGRYHYIAFEYIEGVTIRQKVIRDGPLGVADAIQFTIQIAHALVHAAEREVVHRDIKPSNIIITPSGRAKLVDMGLARQFERRGDADLTQTGMTLGTFDYISPEQARDPRDVDIRGDLYSLGCTLFHMLSGRPPFPEGTVLQKLLQHREETPPDIRRLNPSVPEALAAILVKLLLKDRDHRYQTPEHLARDLGAVFVPRAVALTSIPPNSTPNWARHLFWGGPGLIFLLVLGGMAWWGDGPPGPNPPLGFAPSRTILNSNPTTPPFAPSLFSERPLGSAPSPPNLAPPSPPEPIPRREVAVSPTDDLTQILAQAPPRSSIVLAERGPYELRSDRPLHLEERDLTIRAEVGVRPVIQLARNLSSTATSSSTTASAPTIAALIEIRGGRVTFDGIDFLVDASSFESALGGERTANPGTRVLAAIAAEDAEVVVRRCSFRRAGGLGSGSGSSLASSWKQAAIRLQATNRVASARGNASVASLIVDASEFDGHQVGLLTLGPVDVSIRDVAFGPTLAEQASLWSDNPEPSATPAEFRLEHVSGLLGPGPMFRFSGILPRVLARYSVFGSIPSTAEFAPGGTLLALDTPDRLDWRGADNLYARVAVYLRPGGARPQAPVRSFNAWADDPLSFRESGSSSYDGFSWERLSPTSQNLANSPESPRSFRLALPRSVVHHPGARWGPSGPLPPPIWLATSGVANRTIPLELSSVGVRPANPAPSAPPLVPAPKRSTGTVGESRDDQPDESMNGLTPMPMPTDADPADTASESPASNRPATLSNSGLGAFGSIPLRLPVAVAPTLIRSNVQFLDALKCGEVGARTLVLAADADLDLPRCQLTGSTAHWTIRAERGPTRPRIRFRADSPEASEISGWSAWMVLCSGGVRFEGVDLFLPAAATPPSLGGAASNRPRAVFAVRSGTADLVFTDCSVTIEGNDTGSAVVAILPGDEPLFESPFDVLVASPLRSLVTTETRVRINDCLLRSAGDLVDVAPGCSAELDLDNSVVATGGVLLHAHGREEGRSPGSLRVSLRRIAARLGGGLIHLATDRDHPNLPIASIHASETILTLDDLETPLLRVDGQGDLASLRDRVVWQGRSVAYHRINTYRRDATSRPGVTPNQVGRDSWEATIGQADERAIRSDLGFLDEAKPNQPAWSIRPEDFRLRSESPASDAAIGPDLLLIPSARPG